MTLRLSYSQIKLFKEYPLEYYYKYVAKFPEKGNETKWLDFGKAMHEVLEEYYNRTNTDWQSNVNEKWQKYNLEGRMDYNNFKTHVINGVTLQLNVTGIEEKFFLRVGNYQIVGYLDVVDTSFGGYILDWKSGTYTKDKVDDYKEQLKYYAYFFKRKYEFIPKECAIFFNKTAKMIKFSFTEEDLNEVEQEIIEIGDKLKKMIETSANKPEDWGSKLGFFSGYHYLQNQKVLNYNIVIKNNFCFLEGDVTPKLLEGIDKLTRYDLKNKFWIQKRVLAKNPGMHSKKEEIGRIHLFNKNHRMFSLGHLNRIRNIIRQYGEHVDAVTHVALDDRRDLNVLNKRLEIMPEELKTDKKLRPYQQDAIRAFLDNQMLGFIEIATGGGKTLVTAELMKILDTTTLWICARKELLWQSKKEFETCLGIPFGIIGCGEYDPQNFTVATIESLYSILKKPDCKEKRDLVKYLNGISFAIIDEAHHASAESYQTVFKELRNTRARLGTSGTVERDDGNSPVLHSLIGEIVYKISAKELEEQGYLMCPRIIFYEHSQKYISGDSYAEIYQEAIVENQNRNQLIKELVKRHKGKKCLILTSRIEHGEIIKKMFSDSNMSAEYVHGSTDKEERQLNFNNFKNGTLNILIGTMSIFGEGIDLPNLEIIINAAANKASVPSIQILGRVLRKSDGKTGATYFDFMDHSKFLKVATDSRIKTFKEQGHEIIIERLE